MLISHLILLSYFYLVHSLILQFTFVDWFFQALLIVLTIRQQYIEGEKFRDQFGQRYQLYKNLKILSAIAYKSPNCIVVFDGDVLYQNKKAKITFGKNVLQALQEFEFQANSQNFFECLVQQLNKELKDEFEYGIVKYKSDRYFVTGQLTEISNTQCVILNVQNVKQVIDQTKSISQSVLESKYEIMFSRSLSHNLRHPCCHIISLISMLKIALKNLTELRQNSDQFINQIEQSKQHLHNIKFQAIQILYLTSNFLDFASIQANNFQLKLSKFNILKLISKQLQAIQFQFKRKKVQLKTKYNVIQEEITSDKPRIQQILLKLIQNALKFSKKNKTTIVKVSSKNQTQVPFEHINAKNQNKNQHFIKITVKDQGVGITLQKQFQIFNIFEDHKNVQNLATANMGLPICNLIAKKLGEDRGIYIKSNQKHGSSFTFYIKDMVEFKQEKVQKSPQKEIKNTCSCPLIMIVDDTEMIRYGLQEILQHRGYTTIEACNGKEAVQIYMKRMKKKCCMFQAIIMDCDMPIMNGIDATIKIRSFGLNTKIIGYTAYSHHKDLEQCMESGMNLVLTKPSPAQQIIEAIEK